MSGKPGVAGRIARVFINSKLTPLIIVTSVAARARRDLAAAARGGAADQGADDRRAGDRCPASARRKSRSAPLGRWKSCSGKFPAWNTSTRLRATGESLVIVRFQGRRRCRAEPRQAERKSCSRISTAFRTAFRHPLIKPKSIDDVPILALTFHSSALRSSHAAPAGRAGGRRGESRCRWSRRRRSSAARGAQVRVLLDPVRLASRNLSAAGIVPMLQQANRQFAAGGLTSEQSGSHD